MAISLCVVYTFNFLDRQFLSILAEPVKHALLLSDTQLGMLTGLMFALFYTMFGIPVAALADRYNRVRIVSIACGLWSAFTGACGLATGFASLAIARMGVGVGEAGGAAPSYSIISDYFPPAGTRGRPGDLLAGVPIGTMLGAASGGWIAAHYGWRTAFLVLGVAGLVLAPLIPLVVREPARGRLDPPRGDQPPASVITTIEVFVRSPTLVLTACSAGLTAVLIYGLLSWMPAYLIREQGMSLSQIASSYSVVAGVTIGIGTLAGGYVVDAVAPRRPFLYALLPGSAVLLGLPFLFGLAQAQTWSVALLFMAGPYVLLELLPGARVDRHSKRRSRESARRGGRDLSVCVEYHWVGLRAVADRHGQRPFCAGLWDARFAHGVVVPGAGFRPGVPGAAGGGLESEKIMKRILFALALTVAATVAAAVLEPTVASSRVSRSTTRSLRTRASLTPQRLLGALRWKAPAPVAPWKGVREATQFGPACVQPKSTSVNVYTDDPPRMSEDCLYLNIWQPTKVKSGAPVMVWIHGGAFRSGHTASPVYDGSELARRGVVIVSISYRMGILGFLAHPQLSAESPQHVSGNYGLLDQMAALQWVKENIAAFGGDPANVTIFGESAGALSVMDLVASPQAKGLFTKAIAESGYMVSNAQLRKSRYGLPSAEDIGVMTAKALGANSIRDLRARDAVDLIETSSKGGFVPLAHGGWLVVA